MINVAKQANFKAYFGIPYQCPDFVLVNVLWLWKDTRCRGVGRIFQRGVGGWVGFMLCQSESTHQIGMSFSPSVVDCLLKKGFICSPGPLS